MPSDIEIAQAAKMQRIAKVALEKLGIAEDHLEPYGHYKAKVSLEYLDSLEGQARRQADPRHRDQPDAGGRGQDDHHGRPRRRAEPHRQEGDDLPARAVARAGVRREGRRGRRRLRAGGADGGHQPPLHRRLQRDRAREQPARGDDRQPHPPRQRARDRRAPHRLEARGRHERPRAARHHRRARRHGQRLPAPGRLRHRGRLRGDGDLLPRRPRSRT